MDLLKRLTDPTTKLSYLLLIVPVLIIALYTMLSFLAFTDPTFFYESMTIPLPEHGFMLLSWGGKNTAMVMGLLLATLSRNRLAVLIMMGVFITGQLGDINAGFRTDVNVFITFIGMGLVLLQLGLMVASEARVNRPVAATTA